MKSTQTPRALRQRKMDQRVSLSHVLHRFEDHSYQSIIVLSRQLFSGPDAYADLTSAIGLAALRSMEPPDLPACRPTRRLRIDPLFTNLAAQDFSRQPNRPASIQARLRPGRGVETRGLSERRQDSTVVSMILARSGRRGNDKRGSVRRPRESGVSAKLAGI